MQLYAISMMNVRWEELYILTKMSAAMYVEEFLTNAVMVIVMPAFPGKKSAVLSDLKL